MNPRIRGFIRFRWYPWRTSRRCCPLRLWTAPPGARSSAVDSPSSGGEQLRPSMACVRSRNSDQFMIAGVSENVCSPLEISCWAPSGSTTVHLVDTGTSTCNVKVPSGVSVQEDDARPYGVPTTPWADVSPPPRSGLTRKVR